MKKRYLKFVIVFGYIIWHFIVYRKEISTKDILCIKTHKFQEFIDSDFRNKKGLILFDTLGNVGFNGSGFVYLSFKSASYPYLEKIDYFCKSNNERDYIRLSKDSSLKIDYIIDSLSIMDFYLLDTNDMNETKEVLTPLEAYEKIRSSDIINQESKLFYGFNRDSLEQLVIHQSKKKDSTTLAPF